MFSVLAGGTEEQKRKWLPLLAAGERTLTPAVTEADYGWEAADVGLIAKRDGGTFRLDGAKAYVLDAASASHLLCAARSEDSGHVGLLLVPSTAPGVEIRSLPGFSWNLAEVKLDRVKVDQSSLLGESFEAGWDALQWAIGRAVPLLGAFLVGACQAVYDMSVEYSRTRVQFGTPIGRFQRVQDHIINLVNQLDAARWTTYEALWKLDTSRPAVDSVHLAKAVGSEGLLSGVQFCPRGPCRGRQHDGIRSDPAHHGFAHPVPLSGRPSVPPPSLGGRPGVIATVRFAGMLGTWGLSKPREPLSQQGAALEALCFCRERAHYRRAGYSGLGAVDDLAVGGDVHVEGARPGGQPRQCSHGAGQSVQEARAHGCPNIRYGESVPSGAAFKGWVVAGG